MKCEQHDSTDNGVVEHIYIYIYIKTRKDKRETNNRNCFSHSQIRFLFFLFFRFNSNRHLRLFFSLSSLCACLPLRLNGLWLAQGAHDYLQTVSDNRHPAVARPCPRVHAHCRIVTMVCFATTHTLFFSVRLPHITFNNQTTSPLFQKHGTHCSLVVFCGANVIDRFPRSNIRQCSGRQTRFSGEPSQWSRVLVRTARPSCAHATCTTSNASTRHSARHVWPPQRGQAEAKNPTAATRRLPRKAMPTKLSGSMQRQRSMLGMVVTPCWRRTGAR